VTEEEEEDEGEERRTKAKESKKERNSEIGNRRTAWSTDFETIQLTFAVTCILSEVNDQI
jgi:hypothetical protein